MADDLRQRYARLEYEQGQLWDLVDQVHVGPVSPDKDLLAAIADTIAQATDAWRERAEKAEREAEQRRLAYNAANAMAGVHKLRADRLKAELEHAKGALAGDSEAMSAFMADHAKVVARTREQCDMWQRATEQAEGRLEAVRKYIDEDFRFWRSPAGVAGQYARALIDFIDREDPDRA